MKIYKFFDWDPKTDQEYDLSGREYNDLIEVCFKYSSVMSFTSCGADIDLLQIIEKYHISRPDNIKINNSIYGYGDFTDKQIGLNFYRLCPNLMDVLLSHTNGIFEWIHGWGFNNPENPVFYRENGSIFFSSLIHEGEITLTVNDGEDVSKITMINGWKKVSDFSNHGYSVTAK